MYRGEIQNDSNGGNYNRSLDYTPTSGGLGGGGRYETRNLAVGAGIGRCEEDAYNCCGLYGRGENEDDDPCWDGYEMIGTKEKNGKTVPNCVPKGEGKPFTNKQLTKIILDKNEVIADLERNAYGGAMGGVLTQRRFNDGSDMIRTLIESGNYAANVRRYTLAQLNLIDEVALYQQSRRPPPAAATLEELHLIRTAVINERETRNEPRAGGFWDDVRAGLVKHNQRKKTTPISEEDWKKQMEDYEKPTENWGMDELDGGGTGDSKEPEQQPGSVVVGADGTATLTVKFTAQQKKIILDGVIQASRSGALAYYLVNRRYEELRRGNPAAAADYIAGFEKSLQRVLGATGVLFQFFRTQNGQAILRELSQQPSAPAATRRAIIDRNLPAIYKGVGVIIETTKRGDDRVDGAINGINRNTRIDEATLEGEAAKEGLDWPSGAGRGGAAPKVEAKPSPVAAAAAALKPVREELQKGIGNLIYGEETDPRKQKKGLLGISEEGKEESKKKVEENIVKPIMKNIVVPLATGVKDSYDRIFNPGEYEKRFEAETKKRRIKTEQEQGIFRNKEGEIVKKPRGYYKDSNEIIATGKENEPYVRIPNPIKAAELRPSSRELELAGIKLWEPVDEYKAGNMGKTLKQLQDNDFIFVPEADVKKIYSELRGFVEQEKGKELATGFEELGWTKAGMKDFQKRGADFNSFTPQEKRDYLQVKNLQEKQQLKNAAAKVDKDIADEEAKKVRTEIRGERPVEVGGPPDQARLAKMRDAKAKIVKLQESKAKDVSRQTKMDLEAMEIEKQQRDREYYQKQNADAQTNAQQQADDTEAFKALSPAERSIQLEAYKKELEQSGFSEEQIQEAIGAVGGGAPDELIGGVGAVEFSLQTAARKMFNPTGNMTMAGKETFTPDYDAYGDTIEDGRENAFALSRSMYDAQAIEIPGFDYYEGNASIRFYVKDDEDVVMVGIRGTQKRNLRELLVTWASFANVGGPEDLSFTSRFQEDLRSLQEFQKQFPISQFYYVATGHSLAGAIIDQFLDMGLINEALTYNPAIEKQYILDGDIHNHRVYLDTDPLFILMGQFAPNTEIRVNSSKADFYNPIKEGEYLVKSHSITPVYNPAFEGGGMMGAGKTYTLEEWKRIFDAKLEEKRKQIEARAAKKKDTAKAKRERAKVRRDEMAEIPELEAPFRTSRVIKATPPQAPKKPRKPRLKIVAAPASARVELREELVAEQPRNIAGEFAARVDMLTESKGLIDKFVEDAIKDMYYEQLPDFMKGMISKEKVYKDKFLTLPKKKQDEMRGQMRKKVMTQLEKSGRGMKGGARPRKAGDRPNISTLTNRRAKWDGDFDFNEDQAAIDAHAATVPVPDVAALEADASIGVGDATQGKIMMRQLKERLPGQIRSDMYYDDADMFGNDWAGFANYHYQQLQLLRYLEQKYPDDPFKVMDIHQNWSQQARDAGKYGPENFNY